MPSSPRRMVSVSASVKSLSGIPTSSTVLPISLHGSPFESSNARTLYCFNSLLINFSEMGMSRRRIISTAHSPAGNKFGTVWNEGKAPFGVPTSDGLVPNGEFGIDGFTGMLL